MIQLVLAVCAAAYVLLVSTNSAVLVESRHVSATKLGDQDHFDCRYFNGYTTFEASYWVACPVIRR